MDYKVIFKTISGSHLYGTSRPDSDLDIRGVCLPPMEALLGLSPFEQHEVPGEDTVIYGLRKFCRLAWTKGVPIKRFKGCNLAGPAASRFMTDAVYVPT